MYKFLPYMTNDYSVGLYSEETNDIYHSAHGALTEAFEKFINPLNLRDNIRVLDICYGIGYNTKVLMNEFIKCGYKNLQVDCVDTDSFLMRISPFVNSKICFFDRVFNKKKLFKNVENYNEAKKIVSLKKFIKRPTYKLSEMVNLILYKSLYGHENRYVDNEVENLLREKRNFVFFDKNLLKIHKFLTKIYDKSYQFKNKLPYLHNIYYQYISKRYCLNDFNGINIEFYAKDIREFIKKADLKYDIILLDGFTPQKCPCIWSQDFFESLYDHITDNGQLVTYNASAVVRAGLLNASFKIGNIFDSNKNIIGTFASKKKSLIKHQLTSKQLGLLGTKAGIPFRDRTLDLDNEQIIMNRTNELNNSNLESSSKYLKRCKNEI